MWIKAHVGHRGNELADIQAKRGTELPTNENISITIPQSLIKTTLCQNIYIMWTQSWQAYKAARQSKFFYTEPNPSIAKNILQYGRYKVGLIIRAITGHNALSYHRSKIDPENVSALCRFCTEIVPETFIHLITDCPRFYEHRLNNFLTLPFDPPNTWSPEQLLAFIDHNEISSAFDGFYDGVHYLD